MRTKWVLLACVTALLLAPTRAQADGESAVGRWVFSEPGDRRVLVLRSSGRFELDVRRTAEAARVVGTWRVAEGRLTLTSDDADSGVSVSSFAQQGGAITLGKLPTDGQPMTYQRDLGPLVGRWTDAASAVELTLQPDGRVVRVRAKEGRTEGSYEVAYEEPGMGRGSLTVRMAGEPVVEAAFTLGERANEVSLSDAPGGAPVLTLRRVAASEPAAPSLTGRWRALGAGGAVELEIDDRGSTLQVTSGGQTSTAKRLPQGDVEGAEAQSGGELRFRLTPRGARLHAQFTAVASDGTTQVLPELIFDRVQAGAPSAPSFAGRWESRTPQGTTVLVVTDRGGGTYTLLADGQSIAARLAQNGALTGSEVIDGVTAEVALTLDRDQLIARFAFVRPEGVRESLEPITFVRSSEPEPGTQARDQALFGHWRFTSTEHFVMDFNLALSADGRYRWWIVPSDDEPETGTWRTEAGRLYLRAASAAEERAFGAYALGEGAAVMLITRPDGQKRPYQRQ